MDTISHTRTFSPLWITHVPELSTLVCWQARSSSFLVLTLAFMDHDSEIFARLRAHHGALRQSDLCPTRTHRRAVARLVDARQLRVYGKGRSPVIALPGAEHSVILARHHRGVLTCGHALEHYGVALLNGAFHYHFDVPRGSKVPPYRTVRLHETRQVPQLALHDRPIAPLPQALADYLCCASTYEAVVAADSALHQRLVTRQEVSEHLQASARRQGREHLAMASAGARSPMESVARVRMRAQGWPVQDAVVFPGIGEVDFVVGPRLVVEVDGLAWHDGFEAFTHDRWRDRALAARGLTVVRLPAREVMQDSFLVEVERVLRSQGVCP